MAAGEFRVAPDSWLSGEEDAQPYVLIPATPRVGERLIGYRPGGWIELRVTSLNERVEARDERFAPCLALTLQPDDPAAKAEVLYAPGVGRVAATAPNRSVTLVERTRR